MTDQDETQFVDVELHHRRTSLKAYLLGMHEEDDNPQWIAKSQCADVKLEGEVFKASVPEWIAEKNGWV